MSLKTQHIRFSYVRSYLVPNYSYDAVLRPINVNQKNGSSHTIGLMIIVRLIILNRQHMKKFLINLKNKNITDEKYNN